MRNTMMSNTKQPYNQNIEKFRSYSTLFSRMSLLPVIEEDDFSLLNIKIRRYDKNKIGNSFTTYLEYLTYIYTELCKNRQCEYIYKNMLINLLIKKYRTKNSVIFNEFHVGNSVADIVLFNGTSKAFEIKTELDSDKRLDSQLSDYFKIFKESYIVTHESLVEKYKEANDSVGIIALTVKQEKLILKTIRKATVNKNIDVNVLMRSIRTNEYKSIIENFYGALPDVSSFDMFESCKSMMKFIPPDKLHWLFLNEMKKRKSNTTFLKSYINELRQFCLCTHLDKSEYEQLFTKLNNPINI